jgi:LuxR family maltose regulon positive regulatory protein
MAAPLLHTKLYVPRTRPKQVPRPRLGERLNVGLDRKLTLGIRLPTSPTNHPFGG